MSAVKPLILYAVLPSGNSQKARCTQLAQRGAPRIAATQQQR
jgi:hypothetical protein